MEAENSRSSDRLKIKILLVNPYLLIPKWPQTPKSDQNWRFLITNYRWFQQPQKSHVAYEVKNRQFWSEFDAFAHFGIRKSRGVRRYPYWPLLVTSDFRPLNSTVEAKTLTSFRSVLRGHSDLKFWYNPSNTNLIKVPSELFRNSKLLFFLATLLYNYFVQQNGLPYTLIQNCTIIRDIRVWFLPI